MSYGVRIRTTAGETIFESTVAQGGVVIDLFIATAGEVRTYPAFAGMTVFAASSGGSAWSTDITVDYALGYPRVTMPASYGGFSVAVFAK